MDINSGNDLRNMMALRNIAANNQISRSDSLRKTEKSSFQTMMSGEINDSIQIASGKSMSDDEFIQSLSANLSNQVKAGHSALDLNDIKQQIALGEYDINASDIAKKILG